MDWLGNDETLVFGLRRRRQNDVQMAVCLLLCLGDKYVRVIDQQLLQQWFASYVGMCAPSTIMRNLLLRFFPFAINWQKI